MPSTSNTTNTDADAADFIDVNSIDIAAAATDAADSIMGTEVLAWLGSFVAGAVAAAVWAMFSSAWIGAVMALITFVLSWIAITYGITVLDMHTPAVRAVGSVAKSVFGRVRGLFGRN